MALGKYAIAIPFCACLLVYFDLTSKDQIVEFIFFLLNTFGFSLKSSSPSCPKGLSPNERLFTPEELAKYDGSSGSNGIIYLAFLGIVYDVTRGLKHYGPGGSYAFFAGRDATRAFVTGQFDKTGLVDDVEGLDLDSFISVRQWQDFYEKDYARIGRVVGSYYDNKGCPKDKLDYVYRMYDELKKKEEKESTDSKYFPHCNSEYSSTTGRTRVWCTDMSGGTKRTWVGVPRKLAISDGKTRCACVRNTGPPSVPIISYEDTASAGHSSPSDENNSNNNRKTKMNRGDLDNLRITEYPNCDSTSIECYF